MSPDAQPWTTRSLLQANGSQSTYYTVTIHPSPANQAAVQGQVARLAAMSPHDLQNLLRAQGIISRQALPARQIHRPAATPGQHNGKLGRLGCLVPVACMIQRDLLPLLRQAQARAVCSTMMHRAA